MLILSPTVQIPLEEFDFSYSRSGGPGGQNVNKVSSKVTLRWQVYMNQSLPWQVRARFVEKYGNKLTSDGELILTSQKFRDQKRNIDDCLEKLTEMLMSVLYAPTPRRATKPTRSSVIKVAKEKQQRSERKKQRKAPRIED